MPLTEADLQTALLLWSELNGARARLINHSENQTFAVETPSGERFALRVHRPGYQSLATIESELAWLGALGRDTSLPVPEALPGCDGNLLQQFTTRGGEGRSAVLFRFVAGVEPMLDGNSSGLFAQLGRYAAMLHNHVSTWQRPPKFVRPAWNAQTILPADGLWGDWRLAPGVTPASHALLQRLEQTLRRRLADYGASPDRFGLIHADMRLGNLLVDGDRLRLIDFDDCGLGWFTYDFAAAISFHETHPAIPGLKAAWLEGYCAIRALAPADVASLDTMVMLRRMALLAWIGTHAETHLAQQHMQGFANGTAELAERYLGGALWPL